MVVITFADRATEKRALGFLLGRFSGRVLRTGAAEARETREAKAALDRLATAKPPAR